MTRAPGTAPGPEGPGDPFRAPAEDGVSGSGLCVLAAAVLVPWTFAPALYDQFFIPKLLAASALAACGALAALRESPGRGVPLARPLVAFLAAALLASLRAPDPLPSFLGGDLSYAWSLLGWLPCLALYRLAAVQEGGFAGKLAACLALGSIPVSIFAAAQVFGLDPRAGIRLPSGRAFSSLSSPVALGVYLAAVLPATLHVARAPKTRGVGIAAAVLGAAALYLSGSRGAWIAAVAGSGAYLILTEGKAALKGRLGAALAAGALACVLGLGALAGRRGQSDSERVELWRAAVALWVSNPLVGVGPEGFDLASRPVLSEQFAVSTGGRERQTEAHNDWLQVLAGVGLLGALAYGWLHWEVWSLARAALAAQRGAAAVFTACLVSLFVVVKINAASWTGPFLASVLMGGLAACRSAGRPASGGKRGAALSAAVALAALALACWLAAADRLEALGLRARAQGLPRDAAMRLEAATALRPGEGVYRLNLVNLLWDVAESAPAEAKAMLLQRTAEVAAEGVARRPLDPGASRLLGLVELRRYEWGGEPRLEAARSVFARGLELDPYSWPLLESAARAARLAGNKEEAARLEERLFRLSKKR